MLGQKPLPSISLLSWPRSRICPCWTGLLFRRPSLVVSLVVLLVIFTADISKWDETGVDAYYCYLKALSCGYKVLTMPTLT